jgi:hypothetical protein
MRIVFPTAVFFICATLSLCGCGETTVGAQAWKFSPRAEALEKYISGLRRNDENSVREGRELIQQSNALPGLNPGKLELLQLQRYALAVVAHDHGIDRIPMPGVEGAPDYGRIISFWREIGMDENFIRERTTKEFMYGRD